MGEAEGVGDGLRIAFIFSGSQDVFGSVPFLKYSYRLGQPSQGKVPVRVQIETLMSSLGGETVFDV